jgi:hypothetical protein
MKKTIAGVVLGLALCVPVAVFADNSQLISLYQQLIQMLQVQLGVLQSKVLTITPNSGTAPFTATFILNNQTGTEAIDFGDGHSTGSSGCVTNSKGYCDLSQPLTHTYQFPGTYKVSVYRGPADTAVVISTHTVTVK